MDLNRAPSNFYLERRHLLIAPEFSECCAKSDSEAVSVLSQFREGLTAMKTVGEKHGFFFLF